MAIRPFNFTARSCWCQSCFNSAHAELGEQAGKVCGHSQGENEWSCVYCGDLVTRLTPWYASVYQSVVSWVEDLAWDLKIWWLLGPGR